MSRKNKGQFGDAAQAREAARAARWKAAATALEFRAPSEPAPEVRAEPRPASSVFQLTFSEGN